MNKKASSSVDWMVSMGIFIVTIIYLLVLIKPGITEIQEDKITTENIYSNIYNEANHTIYETEILLKNIVAFPAERRIRINYPFDVCYPAKNIQITRGFTSLWKFVPSDCSYLIFESSLDNGNNKFKAKLSTKKEYVSEAEASYSELIPEHLIYPIIKLQGLDRTSLESGGNIYCETEEEYKEVKRKLKIPFSKDFMLKADFGEGLVNICGKDIPEETPNIVSRYWDDWLIDKNSNKEGVTINLLIW